MILLFNCYNRRDCLGRWKGIREFEVELGLDNLKLFVVGLNRLLVDTQNH